LTLRIKNWEKFQHYKDRKPPWIRLYNDLLDDPDLDEIPSDLFKLLAKIWLAASEHGTDGTLPDIRRLALKVHVDSKLLAKQIRKLNQWIEFDECDSSSMRSRDASNVLASESESESESETETYLTGDVNAPVPCVDVTPTLDLTLLPSQPSDLTSEKKTRRSKAVKAARVAKGAATWDAYSTAYAKRYGSIPERNAKVNSLCVNLVNLLGADKAPPVAAHYLTVRTQPYLGAGHCLELLVRDYQKIKTMWETGRQITQSEAREGDRLQGQGDAWKRAIEKRSAE